MDGQPLHHRARELRDDRKLRESAKPRQLPHGGQWPSAAHLPPHMKRLHAAQMKADQERREAAMQDGSEEERRWPGLVNPQRIFRSLRSN